jgi:endoglucanase
MNPSFYFLQKIIFYDTIYKEFNVMNLLIDILKTPSVSGYESGLKNVILDKFKEYGLITAVSPLGNISGKRMGTFPYTILIDAHYDQIGLIVKKIEENGMIRAQNVGGVDPRVLFNLPLNEFKDQNW